MSLDSKNSSTELLKSVATGLARHGFESKPKGQSIVKKTAFGRQSFHLAFIKHTHDFDITADVAIRFDALENLICESEGIRSEQEKDEGYSLGAELGNLAGTGQRRWTVSTSEDIPPVSASILEAFELIALPYLNRYSMMDQALAALKGDDRVASLHMPIHDARAKRALGLAFLLGAKQQFDEIARGKAEF